MALLAGDVVEAPPPSPLPDGRGSVTCASRVRNANRAATVRKRTFLRCGTILAALLFLFAGARVELVDEVYTIPPSEWRYVQVSLKQTPVGVHADFQVIGAPAHVRVALLSQEDLTRLRADEPHGFLTATPPAAMGAINYLVQTAGEYAVVIDNRGLRAPVRVHLRASLDFTQNPVQTVGYLSRERKLAVILISFAVFFTIVTWSTRKLLKATRH